LKRILRAGAVVHSRAKEEERGRRQAARDAHSGPAFASLVSLACGREPAAWRFFVYFLIC